MAIDIEDIKAKIILHHLQKPHIFGGDYYNFVFSIPADKDVLKFMTTICPPFWCFLYAKNKHVWCKELDTLICTKAPNLLIRLAITFGKNDKYREAVNKSEDPALILEYASTIDERFIKETYDALVDIATKDQGMYHYLRTYSDLFKF
jgi:hypothetical protein